MAIGVGGSGAPRWWLTHSLTEAELYFNIVRNDGAGQKEYRIGSVTTDIDPILEDEWFMASCTFDGASSMKVSHNGVTSADPDLQADGDISAMTHPADVYGVVGNNRVFSFSGRQANHYLFMIAFWDVELGETEITELYNLGNGYLADPRVDNGNYASSANLKNMWLFGNAVSPNLGVNSVADAQNFAAEVNVDDTNIIADYPGL